MRPFTGVLLLTLAVSACSDEQDSANAKDWSLLADGGLRTFPGAPDSGMPPSLGDTHPDFTLLLATSSANKPSVMERQLGLLQDRYDLADRPSPSCKMSRGKPVQTGVRAKPPVGVTYQDLSALTPDQIRALDVFPAGFFPLPHPDHPHGGMVFPKSTIDEIKKQTGRDLARFDVDFDIPEQFLPEFPGAIYLTTRPDLGDVSQGKVITTQNFFDIFKDILNPKQLDGLRLLLTPFPQQQFNLTGDRRSVEPQLGVACLDCHVNGHSNSATHLAQDTRGQELRHRVDTPTLRGVNIQRLFGSQRALKTVEDFTEFEQRGAYFDGDPAAAAQKGINHLDRATQVQGMAEFQELLDFPPAPKLGLDGKLIPATATAAELRGQELFFGKAQCASCHTPPYYTDLTMHNLQMDRFYVPRMINGMMATNDGPIKTFPLRGIKDTPPYLHDGRLLTLDDTVEFFNLVFELHLTEPEKADLGAFLCAL